MQRLSFRRRLSAFADHYSSIFENHVIAAVAVWLCVADIVLFRDDTAVREGADFFDIRIDIVDERADDHRG